MTHGSAFGIRKILICGAGICYLVILRGEGGIAKKVTALWFVLFRFGPQRFSLFSSVKVRVDCLMLRGARSVTSRNNVSDSTLFRLGLNKHWVP